MGLTIRMALYFAFAALASQGLVVFDQVEGTVTFKVEHLTALITGLGGYLATFSVSRMVKARGGTT